MMDFKRYVHHISCIIFPRPGEAKRTRGSCAGAVDEQTMSFELRSTSAVKEKDSILRIVLAGRMVEVYDTAVPAHMVMEKYPGLRLTRPEVFKRPHDSLVGSREMLFPGQKFYLVPESTLKKLKRNYPKKPNDAEEVQLKEVVLDQMKELKCAEKMAEGYVCSAKDYYISQDTWNLCFQRRFMREEERQDEQTTRPFTPPIKKMRMRHGLLDGWKPDLSPIKELSP